MKNQPVAVTQPITFCAFPAVCLWGCDMNIVDFSDFVNDSLNIKILKDIKVTEKREIIDEIAIIENGMRCAIELLCIDIGNKQENTELYSDILYSVNRIIYFLNELKNNVNSHCQGEY